MTPARIVETDLHIDDHQGLCRVGHFRLLDTSVGVPIIFLRKAGSYEQGASSAGKTTKVRLNAMRNERPRDAIDERLIALLRSDARMKLTALARSVSLSRTAVQGRIARLERDGIILGYGAIVREAEEDDVLRAILSLVFSERPCHPVVNMFRAWP